MARKEHRTTPKISGTILYTETAAIVLDSPAWFAWLVCHTTFYLESSVGTFTARGERRNGAIFWYAFRRSHNHLYKAYLGRPGNLTRARLLTVAQQLAEKVGA